MRYVKGHGLQTRSRIVEHASYGLRQRGADGLSVVDLMKLVGLTHGGFYSHFASRDRTIAHWLKLMQEMPVEQRFDVIVDPAGACCGRSAPTSPVQARRRATSLHGSLAR